MRYYELLESLTTGEFTFGFELEAIYLDKENKFKEDSSTDLEFLEDINLIKDIEQYGITGKLVSDSSIETNGSHSIPFEFVSDPLQFSPSNLTKMFKTLSGLKSINCFTNSHCGFHIHIKYPSMNSDDMRWLLACISQNDEYKNTVTSFKDYDFYNLEFADPGFLDELDNAIMNKDNREIDNLLDTSKYRVLRIHPQGTLEWRGPRDFLNQNNLEDIHDFVVHLFGYVRMISKCMAQTTIGEYSKKEFYSIFTKEKTKPDPKGINFIKQYSGKDKEIALNLVRSYPNILDVKFSSPPKIYVDGNDDTIFKIEGDIINGVWNISSPKVIYMSGNFGNAIFRNGYFNGNWTGEGEWIYGVWMAGATYKGESIPTNPRKWEEFLKHTKNK